MGRHKEFDRREALNSAMKVFWEKGFAATSLPDLTKAMGISRSSLYETFKDKESLFEEAMDNYCQKMGPKGLEALMGSGSVKERIKNFLKQVIDTNLNSEYPAGCFVINTAASLSSLDARIAKKIQELLGGLHNTLKNLLKQGQENGEISKDKDLSALAGMLVSALIGIKVMSRIKRDRNSLEEIAKGALEALV